MLSRYSSLLLFYFDLCGFCTEYRPTKYHKRFVYIIFLFHIGFMLFALLYQIYIVRVDDTKSTRFFLSNDSFKSVFILVGHILTVVESMCRRQTQHKFWQLSHCILETNGRCRNFSYVSMFFRNLTIWSFAEGLMHFVYSNLSRPLLEIIYLFIFVFQYHSQMIRSIYYVLHINIVETSLADMACSLVISLTKVVEKNQSLRLHCYQKQLELIDDSIECINRVFGWSNVVNILAIFNILLATLNWSVYLIPISPLPIAFGTVNYKAFCFLFLLI